MGDELETATNGLTSGLAITTVAAVLMIGWGGLFCFAGQKLLKLLLRIFGVLAGAFAGAQVAMEYLLDQSWALWALPIVGGLAGGLLVWFAFLAGVFLAGAGLGAAITHTILAPETIGQSETIVLVAGAVLAGVLALALHRVFFALFTAALGAWALVAGGWYLIMHDPQAATDQDLTVLLDPPTSLRFILIWLIIALAGLAAQISQSLSKRKHAEK